MAVKKRRYRIEIEHNKSAPIYYWYRLVAPNGEVMVASETYQKSRSNSLRAARRFLLVMQTLTADDIVDAK